jgi:hypothetical protein
MAWPARSRNDTPGALVIRRYDGLLLQPVDYELLWLGTDASRSAIGSFSDVHVATSPVWRVVTGYLGVSATPGETLTRVSSHGHPVGSFDPHPDSLEVDPVGDVEVDGAVLRAPGAGVALLADPGTAWSRRGSTLVASGSGGWGVTIVHGPAEAKIRARMALLGSLAVTGGRRG